MAALGSKLVTKDMEWQSNMTELNHLGKALIAKPHKVLGTMNQLFSAKNIYSDNPLSSVLMGDKKTEETITSTEWEWDLKGANTRPLVVMENVMPISETMPGKFKSTFKIKLDESWYVPGDVIHPGTSNKKFQVRIQDEVTRHGDGWVYTVRLNSDNDQDFLPVQYLKPGTKWAKLFSTYGEADTQGGSTQFSTPISLRNQMSKFRKKYKITDYANQEVLAVAVPDSKGGFHKSWMKYAEVEYWQQWYRELEAGYWYGRRADSVMAANGRKVQSGPGLQEQLEDSHIHKYTHLSTTLIEEYLMDIFYSRSKPGQGRNVKGYTGEFGMLQFHRAVEDFINKSGFIKNVENYQGGVKSDLNPNALEAGYQYVKYNMANGSSLELIHNPLYDDRSINFEIDPISGFPVESQRITFLDFSADKGSNIKIMNKKDSHAFGYVKGLTGPYGPTNGGDMAHSGEYYEMHVSKSCGLHIEDVTRCGELILDRN
tara:strand:- start:5187 stop:6641 length:1455 start_codon:yes stop_codon:yes gene_type:complete